MSGDVPDEILDRIRPICLGLPETYEQEAWAGTRWRIRSRTFAHVLMVDPDHRRTYARTVASDVAVCVVTFSSPPDEIGAIVHNGFPFFRAGWGTNLVAMVLEPEADWDEVAELLTESYCTLAPKRLARPVQDRVGGS